MTPGGPSPPGVLRGRAGAAEAAQAECRPGDQGFAVCVLFCFSPKENGEKMIVVLLKEKEAHEVSKPQAELLTSNIFSSWLI